MNNSTLRDNVFAELACQLHLPSTHITVAADSGVVRLTGYVSSYAEKVAAEHAVKGVAGVRAVVTESLEVSTGAGVPADEELAMRARNSVEWSALVPRERVDVSVTGHRVTLTGEVDWQFQRVAAEAIVRGLAGVADVTNEITLRAQPQAADVRSQIEVGLRRSANLDARFIRVTVVDGSVTLDGAVGSWSARERARDVAWMAPGVRAVADLLLIA
jgi:osmotically-inducible protein OsmY